MSLSYSIAGKITGQLVATASLLQGRLAGAALPAPGTWFWESAQPGVLRQFRASLRLGTDLLAGPVAVKLKNEVRAPLWIAAVLVGEGAAAPERLERFWALEDR